MTASRHATVGSHNKAGRRPARLRTNKAVLERVIRGLYERGIGAVIASRLTGYSQQQIWSYAKDWGCPRVDNVKRAEWIYSLLPEDMQTDIRMIRTRSEVAHARANNKVNGRESRYVHDTGVRECK